MISFFLIYMHICPYCYSLTYGREAQCTCMTQEQYARLRAQDPRYSEYASKLSNVVPLILKMYKTCQFFTSFQLFFNVQNSKAVKTRIYTGSSTLPRTTTRAIETEAAAAAATNAARSDKVAAATSSTSLYDNVTNSQATHQPPPKRKMLNTFATPHGKIVLYHK